MTLTSPNNVFEYAGGTAAVSFTGPRAFKAAHIAVSVFNTTTKSVTPLTVNTHYFLDGLGRANTTVLLFDASLAPSGTRLVIKRTVPLTQETAVTNQGAFLPEIHEDAFDFLTMQTQQLGRDIARTLRFNVDIPDSEAMSAELPIPNPGMALVWNTTGAGLSNASVTGLSPAVSPSQILTGSSYTVAASDNGKYLRFTSAFAITLNINPDATTPLPLDFELGIDAGGANITITPGSGVTVTAPKGGTLILELRDFAVLKRIGVNTFRLIGSTKAA